MSLFAQLGNYRVTTGAICIQALGIWWADILLDQVASFTGKQTLTLGALNMVGTPTISDAFTGSTRVRIVGGAAGWRNVLPPKSYQHDLGVKKSTVIGDAAAGAGEQVSIASDGIIGQAFVRRQAPAARVLEQVGDFWFMRPDGVTQVGPRSANPILSDYDIISAQLAIGQLFIANDHPEDWTPGRTFKLLGGSVKTLTAVFHHVEKDKVRTEAWVS